MSGEAGEKVLSVQQIEVFYQHVIQVLKGVSVEVGDRQIVCLLGANGAGKSTTLKAISGLLVAEDGKITDGRIEYGGKRLDRLAAHEIARRGILQVLEGRRVFEHLTTEENLRSGHLNGGGPIPRKLDQIYAVFPRLKELKKRKAGWLSGGEQQMLAIGRALMGEPKLLLLDEPSLGLAPLLVRAIFDAIRKINRENGTSIFLVEQNAALALEIADYAYVMENGKIVMDGPAAQVRENPDVKEFYLGLSVAGDRKSYRDTKHYKRRKRWL
ncbi:MAG: ABC transporter ATP-binding protein [Candidatus Deferrimicrobiaceae bacterium]